MCTLCATKRTQRVAAGEREFTFAQVATQHCACIRWRIFPAILDAVATSVSPPLHLYKFALALSLVSLKAYSFTYKWNTVGNVLHHMIRFPAAPSTVHALALRSGAPSPAGQRLHSLLLHHTSSCKRSKHITTASPPLLHHCPVSNLFI